MQSKFIFQSCEWDMVKQVSRPFFKPSGMQVPSSSGSMPHCELEWRWPSMAALERLRLRKAGGDAADSAGSVAREGRMCVRIRSQNSKR
ncbi:hypothetical protein Mapa_000982 [Marchantia paleacea]|nr:hypothetical protein Mapa_000982 [Marchantia paleacea]